MKKSIFKSTEVLVFVIIFLLVAIMYLFLNNSFEIIINNDVLSQLQDKNIPQSQDLNFQWSDDTAPLGITDGYYSKSNKTLYLALKNVAEKDIKIEKILLINEPIGIQLAVKNTPSIKLIQVLKPGERTYLEIELENLPKKDIWIVNTDDPLNVSIMGVKNLIMLNKEDEIPYLD